MFVRPSPIAINIGFINGLIGVNNRFSSDIERNLSRSFSNRCSIDTQSIPDYHHFPTAAVGQRVGKRESKSCRYSFIRRGIS